MQSVAVIGSGLNGLAASYGLAKYKIQSTLFDESTFSNNFQNDIRTSFISHKTMAFFDNVSNNIKDDSGIIKYIYSFKNNRKSIVELKGHNMGYVVNNSTLKYKMAEYIQKSGLVKIIDNHKIASILPSSEYTIIDGQKFSLTICAMGAKSTIYDTLNIKQYTHDYKQTAFVCDISHTLPHQNIAVELFGNNYILAVLPKLNQHKSSIILNIDNSANMNDTELLYFLQSQVRIRHIGIIQDIITPIIAYPLFTRYCKIQHKDSVFLIGDAFHALHPVLGQGFNLSVKDITKLCDHINLANKLGISPALDLATLARGNIANHIKIGMATHFFAKAFITQNKYANFATDALISIGSVIPSKITSSILQKIL